ncbi:hypothetical protein HUS23_04230 [Ectothiorhodospiraceae bacterium 2226]|nr:hypothetical protein HUS23_04230 [Ectothiorhodospiraceae bacterium 2226]
MTEYEPMVGQWYRNLEDGRVFEVVAADEETVEVQHEDGDVGEYDLDAWYDLALERVEEPADFRGPFDDVSDENNVAVRRSDELDSFFDKPRGRR